MLQPLESDHALTLVSRKSCVGTRLVALFQLQVHRPDGTGAVVFHVWSVWSVCFTASMTAYASDPVLEVPPLFASGIPLRAPPDGSS